MTGIERHWQEERRKRMVEFRRRLVELRAEFSDLDLLYVEPVAGDGIATIEIYNGLGEVIEMRKPTRRWSWK